jgi:hypothetical protein
MRGEVITMSWYARFRDARFLCMRPVLNRFPGVRHGAATRRAVVLLTLTAVGGGLAAAPATAGPRPQDRQTGHQVQQTEQTQQKQQLGERQKRRSGEKQRRTGRLGACAAGQLCLWSDGRFKGHRRTYELSGTDIESCVPLPKGATAESFANRTGRPVTLYQSRKCAETGEFSTFPSGSWTPHSAYRARALKIWEH